MQRNKLRIWKFLKRDLWRFDTSADGATNGMPWLKTAALTIRHFVVEDMWSMDIAALTYSTLMALIPLVAMIVVVTRGFGYEVAFENWLYNTFSAQPLVAEYVVDFVHNYLANTKQGYIISVGLVMMIYTITMLMKKIERAFNKIWHVEERSLIRIFTDYTAIFLFLVTLILASAGLSYWAVRLTTGIKSIIGNGAMTSGVTHLMALLPLYAFFVVIYTSIPNTFVRIRSTLIPALLASIAMLVFNYFYIRIQLHISSYNVIYGSLAALPLFLLWLQISWAICMFGALLCHKNQNLHYYDHDTEYDRLSHDRQMDVCALVMHHVCRQFKQNGKTPYTAHDLHQLTGIPQQIINKAVEALIAANLLGEDKSEKRGLKEMQTRLHPKKNTQDITYGLMCQLLDKEGDKLPGIKLDQGRTQEWQRIKELRKKYIEEGKKIELSEV